MGDDICVWADGTWCYAHDLPGMLTFMSDDFTRLPFDGAEWSAFDKG